MFRTGLEPVIFRDQTHETIFTNVKRTRYHCANGTNSVLYIFSIAIITLAVFHILEHETVLLIICMPRCSRLCEYINAFIY